MKKIVVSIFLGLVLHLTVTSQNFNKAKMDSFFDVLSLKNKAMGSLVISKHGKVIYSRAIGYSVISEKDKVNATTATKYRIGSVSKMVTAIIMMQLVEERKISFSTTLDTYFPTLPNAKLITVSHLLNHRSGLHDFTRDPDYMKWLTDYKTHDDMLKIIAKYPTDFSPNEKFAYCNSNYVILGYIIEKITKKTYSKEVDERIVSKIGLSDTYVGGKINSDKLEAFSYNFNSKWEKQPETDMSIPGAAGAIVSTPSDLAKLIEALFALKLINSSSLKQMTTIVDSYGMGIYDDSFDSKLAYGHSGSIDGFVSNLDYFPNDSLAISYCSNYKAYSLKKILRGIYSIYFNKVYVLPTFNTLVLKTEELDKYLGTYSSKQLPLKIKVAKDGTNLLAEATGQSPFLLEAIEKNKFKFEAAGIELEFNPEKQEVLLKQGGGSYIFEKGK